MRKPTADHFTLAMRDPETARLFWTEWRKEAEAERAAAYLAGWRAGRDAALIAAEEYEGDAFEIDDAIRALPGRRRAAEDSGGAVSKVRPMNENDVVQKYRRIDANTFVNWNEVDPLLADPENLTELAKQLGIHITTLSQRRGKLGLPPLKRGRKPNKMVVVVRQRMSRRRTDRAHDGADQAVQGTAEPCEAHRLPCARVHQTVWRSLVGA